MKADKILPHGGHAEKHGPFFDLKRDSPPLAAKTMRAILTVRMRESMGIDESVYS